MKKLDFLLIGLFILLIVVSLFAVKYYTSEGHACRQDPLAYAEKVLGDPYSCSCSEFQLSDSQYNFSFPGSNPS